MKKKDDIYPPFWLVVVAVLSITGIYSILKMAGGLGVSNSAEKMVNDYAKSNGMSLADYPEEVMDMLEVDEDTKDFVLNYPQRVKNVFDGEIDLSEYAGCAQPPLLMQWDSRWGYFSYNGGVIGLKGSAPTSLSMAAIYKLQDTSLNPRYIAEMAAENDWENKPEKLLSEGARMLGISVKEIPSSDSQIRKALSEGNTVMCLTDGNYLSEAIVIRGTSESGGYLINDPMSRSKSEKEYNYSQLQSHLKKIWSYS